MLFNVKISHLLTIIVCLPECDTVLLGHIPALGEQFLVRNLLLALITRLLHKQLGRQLLLCVLHWLQSHLTLLVWNNFTLGLGDVDTNILRLCLALTVKYEA